MRCRVLPHRIDTGITHMAIDDALLEIVDGQPQAAWLRTYEWSEPTLSLGYFQRHDQAIADPRWRGVPLVRRSTGGGAIWHDRELTYAIVLPRSHPAADHAPRLYHAVHAAFVSLLAEHGIAARRRGQDRDQAGTPPPFLCFHDRDPEDIVLGAAKVVGSAQRRKRGAVLQHGSFLLATSQATPELPGVSELAGRDLEAALWAQRLIDRLVEVLALEPRIEDLDADGWSLVTRRRELHASQRWLEKR